MLWNLRVCPDLSLKIIFNLCIPQETYGGVVEINFFHFFEKN